MFNECALIMNENSNTEAIKHKDISVKSYTPSELIIIMGRVVKNNIPAAELVSITGIFKLSKPSMCYGDNNYYDHIVDASTNAELLLLIPNELHDGLEDGSNIVVISMLELKTKAYSGKYEVALRVTRIVSTSSPLMTNTKQELLNCHTIKAQRGFKNVDTLIEDTVEKGRKLRLLAVYPLNSLAPDDFKAGLGSNFGEDIELNESRVNFADPQALRQCLYNADNGSFDIIALLRGGGEGLSQLDNPLIAEALARLNTAWLYGIGHENDQLFIRNIADKAEPAPKAAGIYIQSHIERAKERMRKRKELSMELQSANKNLKTFRRFLVTTVSLLILAICVIIILMLSYIL